MKIRLNNVRLAFPALFTAKSVKGDDKPAFSASLLLDPSDTQVKKVNDAIDAVAIERWGARAPAMLKQLRAADKTCLHDGELKSNYDGFAGMLFVSARSTTRPLTIDQSKNPVTESDGKIYAGCYVNAVIELWAQDNSYGKRVNASLTGVQFARDGDRFAGGAPATLDDFDEIAVEESADDLF